MLYSCASWTLFSIGFVHGIGAQRSPVLVHRALTAPGNTPFHLKASLSEGSDQIGQMEEYWMAPNHWRRMIKARDFSQTITVDGDRVLDAHSGNYMPVNIEWLVTALLNPEPLLAQYEPGDIQQTKANGSASESGVNCSNGPPRMCMGGGGQLRESVEIVGHWFQFTGYVKFEGKRVAHQISSSAMGGDSFTLKVTELKSFKNEDAKLLSVDAPTPAAQRLQTEVLAEPALRDLATDKPDLIWPQVLDGTQTGPASFYIGIDTSGRVREVLPIKTVNERSNDSAVNMLSRWKFKPLMRDGVPVQAEGLLTFTLNTREYGPAEPLSDADARKLATNLVDPVVPPGFVPPGSEFKIWVAVDADGNVIEEIILSGPSKLFVPVDRAIHQWHLKPFMENGQPRPYRALLVFKF